MKRIGFFAGSFDPFTVGHLQVIKKALELFDEIVRLVSDSSDINLLTLKRDALNKLDRCDEAFDVDEKIICLVDRILDESSDVDLSLLSAKYYSLI